MDVYFFEGLGPGCFILKLGSKLQLLPNIVALIHITDMFKLIVTCTHFSSQVSLGCIYFILKNGFKCQTIQN